MLFGKKVIALCLSKVNDDVSRDFIEHLSYFLKERDWRLFVYASCSDLFWNSPEEIGEAYVFSLIDYDIIDAVVIMEERIKSRDVIVDIRQNCTAKNIPVVTVGGLADNPLSLEFDFDAGFALVVRHIVEQHGISDVHMIAGIKGNEFSERRIDVFKKVLSENNIPFSEDMVSYGDFWATPTEEAVIKLIKENRVPKAFVCANDSMALAVCAVLRNNGINVPSDVLVTGFDGIESIYFSVPKITSCLCDYEDMAARTAKLIEELLSGNKDPETPKIIPRLLISESCGCECENPINLTHYLNDLNNRFFRYQEEGLTFHSLSYKVQTCNNISEVAKNFDQPQYFYNMACILRPEFIDEKINPLVTLPENTAPDKLIQLFNTDYPEPFKPKYFRASNILLGLEGVFERNVPIIFFPLNFLEIPFGYVCFHYGDYDPANYNKMPQIVNTLNSALGSFRNLKYQEHLIARIEEMYKTDPLTGLLNRNGFIKEYDRLVENTKTGLTVILADLDGLKHINDTYGHGEGDVAIRAVGLALKACCPKDAVCARFGGDEMIAVVDGEYNEDIKSSIDKYLECYTAHSGKPYTVSASVGVYKAAHTEINDFKELLNKSDKLMYMDKKKKKEFKKV